MTEVPRSGFAAWTDSWLVWLVLVAAILAIAALEGLAWLALLALVPVVLAGVRRLREVERSFATTDAVTGVRNSRSFHELVELERTRALRYNRPFTLAYMGVDGFKTVNDRLGHSAGDDALRLIANAVRDNIRSVDTIGRLGGDEFGILFPETGPGAAEVALDKVRTRLLEASETEKLGVGFSIGAVIVVGAPDSVDGLIRRADALMDSVKYGYQNGLACEVLNENFGIEAILRRS